MSGAGGESLKKSSGNVMCEKVEFYHKKVYEPTYIGGIAGNVTHGNGAARSLTFSRCTITWKRVSYGAYSCG